MDIVDESPLVSFWTLNHRRRPSTTKIPYAMCLTNVVTKFGVNTSSSLPVVWFACGVREWPNTFNPRMTIRASRRWELRYGTVFRGVISVAKGRRWCLPQPPSKVDMLLLSITLLPERTSYNSLHLDFQGSLTSLTSSFS